ncbi:MAG TPA: thioredoxin domain-containing protein [Candidatus Paceibacterota bacterium]|nr:thioredoxin domain-containing protein [Candidatus Paceibacterota bacterium]
MPDEKKKFEISPALAILVCGVLISGSILFVNLHPSSTAAADPNTLPADAHVPAPSASDHIYGSLNAPIVLVEYSDFQCPYCQMVHPTLKRLVDESSGKIAWVYREYPLASLHPQARPAALAAECIADELGNDAFWKFADTIFADQTKMSPEYYAQLAAQFGANPATFASCVSSEKFAGKLAAQTLEAQQNGGNGTPFTVIVGAGSQVPVSGAQAYETFKGVIDAMLARQ